MLKAATLTIMVLAGANATTQVAPNADPKKDTGLFEIATDKSCIGGHNPFAKDTVARIRALSEDTLRKYINLAGVGTNANVRPSFTTKKSALEWGERDFSMEKVVLTWSRDGQAGNIDSVDDPVARAIAAAGAGAETLLKSDQFLVGGAKLSSMGIWRVVAPGDPNKVIGWYRARFLRQNSLGGQAWDLVSLELITGPGGPVAITQYCVEPGDVEYNRGRLKAEEAERARKKSAREANKP